MNSYQHILVAVDLSVGSINIALKAQQLATMNQAKLSIIHVVEMTPFIDVNYDAVSFFNTDIYQSLLINAETNLTRFINETNFNPQQNFLEQGDARDEIIRIAEENKVDLIVLGSHGRRGLALLLGSTANAVLHHAHCDVLAVRLMDD